MDFRCAKISEFLKPQVCPGVVSDKSPISFETLSRRSQKRAAGFRNSGFVHCSKTSTYFQQFSHFREGVRAVACDKTSAQMKLLCPSGCTIVAQWTPNRVSCTKIGQFTRAKSFLPNTRLWNGEIC